MTGSRIVAIIRKDFREFSRNRFFVFMTLLVLVAYVAVFWFLPDSVDETVRIGVSNTIISTDVGGVTESGTALVDSKLTADALAQVADLAGGTISSTAANDLIEILFNDGGDPKALVEEKGMAQVSDDSALETWADEAIAGNDKAVADYKSGNGASINALMGSVMKASRGKANPPAVIAMLKQKLDA